MKMTPLELENLSEHISRIYLEVILEQDIDLFYNIFNSRYGEKLDSKGYRVIISHAEAKAIMDNGGCSYISKEDWDHIEDCADFLIDFEREVHRLQGLEANVEVDDSKIKRLNTFRSRNGEIPEYINPAIKEEWLKLTPEEVKSKIRKINDDLFTASEIKRKTEDDTEKRIEEKKARLTIDQLVEFKFQEVNWLWDSTDEERILNKFLEAL